MISFRKYFEINDVMSRDISGLKLQQSAMHDHKHSWYMDGEKYTLGLKKIGETIFGIQFSDIWSIQLEGPNGLRLTKANKNPLAVYTQMLLGIRKLMQIEEVSGFNIEAADEQMIPVYDKMVKQFLPDFIRITPDIIIKKDVLQRELARLDPARRDAIQQSLQQASNDFEDELDVIQAVRDDKRSDRRF